MKRILFCLLALAFFPVAAVRAAEIQPVPLGNGANSCFVDEQPDDKRERQERHAIIPLRPDLRPAFLDR